MSLTLRNVQFATVIHEDDGTNPGINIYHSNVLNIAEEAQVSASVALQAYITSGGLQETGQVVGCICGIDYKTRGASDWTGAGSYMDNVQNVSEVRFFISVEYGLGSGVMYPKLVWALGTVFVFDMPLPTWPQ